MFRQVSGFFYSVVANAIATLAIPVAAAMMNRQVNHSRCSPRIRRNYQQVAQQLLEDAAQSTPQVHCRASGFLEELVPSHQNVSQGEI